MEISVSVSLLQVVVLWIVIIEAIPYSSHKCGPCECISNTAKCIGTNLTYIPDLPANVTILEFIGNNVHNLNATTIAPISKLKLKQFTFRNNNLVNISSNAFSSWKKLKLLDIGANEHIHRIALKKSLGSVAKTLNTLKLDGTGLTGTNDLFGGLRGSSVTTIDFSSNRIKHLNLAEFEHLKSLTGLLFQRNWIQNVQFHNFSLPNLLDLNLANNEIARFTPTFCPKSASQPPLYVKLRSIDLSGNFINVISPQNWNCLKYLSNLSLAGNVVTHLQNNSFSKLPRLITLDLSNMARMVEHIDELAFNSSSLQSLNLSSSHIYFNNLQFASEIFKHCPNLLRLNIAYNQVSHLSSAEIVDMFSPLKNLNSLNLKHIGLKRTPKGIFQMMPNMTELILSDNLLQNLDGTFENVISLRTLSVKANRIGVLTKASFPDELMTHLKELDLTSNPFECTCDLLWFRDYIGNIGAIGRTKLKKWPQGYQCNSPPQMYKKMLSSYNPTKTSCAKDYILIISLTSSASLLLVGIITTMVIYRNIWYIRYWRYKLRRSTVKHDRETQRLLDNIVYDAYVIYADDDGHFVHGELRNVLEGELKYKLFIWHRNAEAGIATVDAMADGIYASNNVIAIVSNKFLNDSWCKFQLDVSVNKQLEEKRVMVTLLVLDDIDYCSLSKSWCVQFTKLKTVRWCSDRNNIKGRLFLEEMKQQLQVIRAT